MASQPVLNLDQLTDRPVVLIDGAEYRLFTIDLLPALDNHRVKKLLNRIDVLSAKADLSDAEMDELGGPVVKKNGKATKDDDGEPVRRGGGLYDKATRIVLDAPAAIHDKLTDRQRVEVLQVFLVPSWVSRLTPAAASAAPTEERPTGASSPPDSAGSTQA